MGINQLQMEVGGGGYAKVHSSDYLKYYNLASGGAGGRGNNSSDQAGSATSLSSIYGNMLYLFNTSSIKGTAGSHSNSTADHSSGGGASAYSGSTGGNGIYHSDGGSGTKGGGRGRRQL